MNIRKSMFTSPPDVVPVANVVDHIETVVVDGEKQRIGKKVTLEAEPYKSFTESDFSLETVIASGNLGMLKNAGNVIGSPLVATDQIETSMSNLNLPKDE